ncbi:MAG: LysE family translocator [Pseudomonadota bacterium]
MRATQFIVPRYPFGSDSQIIGHQHRRTSNGYNHRMIAFCLSVLLLLITPGPGVLSTAGVGAAFGFKPGLRYVTGLWIGTNLVALIVISGLAAILLAIDWTRNLLLFGSAAFLCYIALKVAFAGNRIAFIDATEIPGLRAGIILQIINPKAYAVNITWFSGFILLPDSLITETVIKFFIINLIWIPIHLGWLAIGSLVNQLDLKPATHRLINFAMAAAMLFVVGLALWSLL